MFPSIFTISQRITIVYRIQEVNYKRPIHLYKVAGPILIVLVI